MLHGLSCKIVQHIGVAIVSYVVEIDQPADDIILQAGFLVATPTQPDDFSSPRPEIMNPKLLRRRLQVEGT